VCVRGTNAARRRGSSRALAAVLVSALCVPGCEAILGTGDLSERPIDDAMANDATVEASPSPTDAGQDSQREDVIDAASADASKGPDGSDAGDEGDSACMPSTLRCSPDGSV